MSNLFVTKEFIANESCHSVYDSYRFEILLSPLLVILGLLLGFLAGMAAGGAASFFFIPAVYWGIGNIVGLAIVPFPLALVLGEHKYRRLRLIRKSPFGPTLSKLFSLYRHINRQQGIGQKERGTQLSRIVEMMDQVWREGHKLLGLTIDEAPSLKSAEDLLGEFEHIQKAIKELEQSTGLVRSKS